MDTLVVPVVFAIFLLTAAASLDRSWFGSRVNIGPNGDLFHGDLLYIPGTYITSIPTRPSGTVNYRFKDGDFTPDETAIMKDAIDKLNTLWLLLPCINWRPYDEKRDTNFVTIQKGSGCWSYLGCTGGEQFISIGEGCCYIRIIQHECLHAMGFYHQHQRPDRDGIIGINKTNMDPQWYSQFEKMDIKEPRSYDLYSIMHYEEWAFSSNGLKTIYTLKDVQDADRIGHAEKPSDEDVRKLEILYGCLPYAG